MRHAEFVAVHSKQAGVKKLITVDPHTTYAVKVLFPKYIGERFDVKTYFELIDFSSKNGNGRVTIHDSCFYGRHLELSDVPREVLATLGVECVPLEIPDRTRTVAADRLNPFRPGFPGKFSSEESKSCKHRYAYRRHVSHLSRTSRQVRRTGRRSVVADRPMCRVT